MNRRKLLTVPEVAPILRVSEARAYELARDGLLPVVRLGRQVRVDPDVLAEWIRQGGATLEAQRGHDVVKHESSDDAAK